MSKPMDTPGVRTVDAVHCAFGARWRKSTRFLCGGPTEEDLANLRRRCSGRGGKCAFSDRAHIQLAGSM
eukprot:5589013-Lingulodinium_polyedra.AAC.1